MSEPTEIEESGPSLLTALEKVRWRLFKSVATLFVSFMVAFTLVHSTGVTEVLVHPVRPFLENQNGRLAAFSPSRRSCWSSRSRSS